MIALLLACTGTPAAVDPTPSEPFRLELAQDLGIADFQAAEATPPWADRPTITGPGVALVDLNADGWLDVVGASPTGSTWALINDGAGTLQADPSITVDGGPIPAAQSVSAGDLDNNGKVDLYLGTWEGLPDLIALGPTFHTVEAPDSLGHSTTAAMADYDADGDLDVYVGRYTPWPDYDEVLDHSAHSDRNWLYINEPDGLSTSVDLLPEELRNALVFHGQWVDANLDGLLDLYQSNDFGYELGPNELLLNQGGGLLARAGEDCGCELGMEAMGVAVGDLDGEGSPDLYITDIGGPNLLINDGAASFYDAAKANGAHVPISATRMASWGTLAVDLDLDGDLDLPVVFGALNFWDPDNLAHFWDEDGNEWLDTLAQEDLLLENQGDGTFIDATAASGWADADVGRAIATGDLNGDGRPDLVTAGWRAPSDPYVRVWLGRGGGHSVRLLMDPAFADVGVRIDASIGDRTLRRWHLPSTTFSTSAPEILLGLGTAEQVDRLTLTGLDGHTTTWTDIPADTALDLGGAP